MFQRSKCVSLGQRRSTRHYSMIYIRLGGVELQQADKAWRESALKPKVQVCAANQQSIRRLLLAGLVHSRHRFEQSILSWLSKAIELEHILAHTKRVWIGRHRIKAYFNVSETHLDRPASSGSTFDSRAKVFFLSLATPTMHFARQASSGSETTRQAGEAIKTPWSFRSTSVERERNYGGVDSKHLWCRFSSSQET